MPEHALRRQLHNEIHARPYERLTTPQLISHMAFVADPAQQAAAHAHLCTLLADHHLPLPAEGGSYYAADVGRVRLRWERHGEFISYTFSRAGLGSEPQAWFELPAWNDIDADWREAIPGQLLSANHVALLPEVDDLHASAPSDAALDTVLDADALIASGVADGEARVYTDLRIHADGCTRFVVLSRPMTPRRRGRLTQRLLEIETYRMLALLALPDARRIMPQLAEHERELGRVMDAIRTGRAGDDRDTLEQLSGLASTVEGVYAQHHARFTASAAYHDLVERRVADLHETPFDGLQSIGQFLDRRLSPAMQTCAAAQRRLQGLSERIARCSGLLRTRVDVDVQQHNRELLASMNRRQYLQLRLQQTVEGLSVAAITYYASTLVGHLAEPLQHWSGLDPALVQGVSIPPIALALWLALRRAHHKLGAAEH